MNRYDLITPEGTRDLLFDECTVRRNIEEQLRDVFISYGYSEVITPMLEFFDVFNGKKRYFQQEAMYKLTDEKGRLIVIRPDSTLPIARLVATRLRDGVFPLRLFYSQTILRVNPKDSGRDDEMSQSGIELIGGDTDRTNFESTALAIEVLKSCNAGNYRFEIGSTEFFKILINRLSVSEQKAEEIRTFVATKNYPALNAYLKPFADNPAAEQLCQLPKLFGGEETFKKANIIFTDDETKKVLEELKSLYKKLQTFSEADTIAVDFSLVHKAEYYTGLVFRGYIQGYGMPILSGGRYDTLMGDFGAEMNAIGFGVNVSAIAKLISKKANITPPITTDILVYTEPDAFAKGMNYCKQLTAQGYKVEFGVQESLQTTKSYAQEKGISQIHIVTKDGTVTVQNIGEVNE